MLSKGRIAGLCVLAAYLLFCAAHTLGRRPVPEGIPSGLVWFGSWEMFTLKDDGAHAFEALAYTREGPQPVDLEALFPTEWESGSRFQRAANRQKPIADAVCHAICERHPDEPLAVELIELSWTRTPGVFEPDPPGRARRKTLVRWVCETPLAKPVAIH